MKSSLHSATAVLRDLAGWISGRAGDELSEADHVPFVVSACGYRVQEEESSSDASSEFGATGGRWLPGPSLDNFS
jgi:hypothetical protein